MRQHSCFNCRSEVIKSSGWLGESWKQPSAAAVCDSITCRGPNIITGYELRRKDGNAMCCFTPDVLELPLARERTRLKRAGGGKAN